MIKRIIEYLRYGIWQNGSGDEHGRREPWYERGFKIFIYTLKGFGNHQIVFRASALTFYTLMSLVPVAALIYAIVRGFGIDTNFVEALYLKFPEYATIIDNVSTFANRMIERTSSGVIASVGVVVLFWAVMRVFGNMEKTMNAIWEIKTGRSFARKFSDYVAVVFIAPLLWVGSNGIILYLRNVLSHYVQSWFVEFLFGSISFVILWIMFAFIYYVMPNTKVKFKSALVAGIVAGTLFQIFQLGYFWVQGQVSNYNAIYGSFAAIPLLLIWLQISWAILFFGAELSFAHQNLKRYEQEREAMDMSTDHKRKVLLASMVCISRHYIDNDGAITDTQISDELDMPVRIIREVVYQLEQAGLVAEIKDEKKDKETFYIPALDIHTLTIFDVIDKVDRVGTEAIDVDESDEMQQVCKAVDDMKRLAYGSSTNVPLIDIIRTTK